MGREIYFQNVNTGEQWMLDPKLKLFEEDFLGWTEQGCRFLLRADNFDILEVGLHGQIYRTVFSIQKFQYPGPDKASKWVDLSSSGDKIAFDVVSGELKEYSRTSMHYDRMELFVSAPDGHTNLRQITFNGGNWYHQWSPDSQAVVYTDFDEQKRQQVYYISLTGEKPLKLTHFKEPENIPAAFQWSPNGKYILMDSMDSGNFTRDVTVFDLTSGWTMIEIKDVYQAWWEEDSSLAYWKGQEITWVDLNTNETIRRMDGLPKPGSNINPYGSNGKFGCFENCFGNQADNMIIYDLRQNKLIRLSHAVPVKDTEGWISLPDTFPGEKACEK